MKMVNFIEDRKNILDKGLVDGMIVSPVNDIEIVDFNKEIAAKEKAPEYYFKVTIKYK